MQFRFKSRLAAHIANHTAEDMKEKLTEKDSCCLLCNREFGSPENLKRHMDHTHSDHGGKKSLMTCRFCPKQYINEMSLLNHEASHGASDVGTVQCEACPYVSKFILFLYNFNVTIYY